MPLNVTNFQIFRTYGSKAKIMCVPEYFSVQIVMPFFSYLQLRKAIEETNSGEFPKVDPVPAATSGEGEAASKLLKE